MDEAFLELLEHKDFAYITVKEICGKAEVNRSTFYLHYETIEQLNLITPEYLTPYLSYIRENKRLFRTAVEKATVLRMDEAYRW